MVAFIKIQFPVFVLHIKTLDEIYQLLESMGTMSDFNGSMGFLPTAIPSDITDVKTGILSTIGKPEIALK